ncbi:PrpF domain-containing protein [Aureivirga sp. CE67]|uniref:PrpF domain-containing protein n=1 Tax=Aureivirga sp. CE67 TaxID=1788983 RepID=UPI0018CBF0EF|nr:PrpF domain-containing protein [Aureivirga sp. CE67]
MKDCGQQLAVPCTYMRGGTSKAIFVKGEDLPPAGHERDAVLMRMMGNPDINEIDGMGGAQLVTSKLAVIDPSTNPDADIDYTFGQAEILKANIDYRANCGNISSAVGPFAIAEGYVKAVEPVTVVRVFNTNSQKILYLHVPVVNGEPQVMGDYHIDGVPGTGASILMDYHKTLGAETGKCLPTGNVTDILKLDNGKSVEITVCDYANVSIFVHAKDLGIECTESKPELDNNKELLDLVREIRGKIGEQIGFCKDWKEIDDVSPLLPLVFAVREPESTETEDIRIRLFLLNKCHPTLAGTGSVCLGASCGIEGSVSNKVANTPDIHSFTLRARHPLGIMPVIVESKPVEGQNYPDFTKLAYHRTARKIMKGDVFIPNVSYKN